MRSSRLNQVSAGIIIVLLLLVFLVYLKQRNHSLIQAKKCSAPTPSSGPAGQHKNGFIATPNKCCDAVRGNALEHVCIHDSIRINRGAKPMIVKNDSELAGCSSV
jgi:hypothetical protein